MELRVHVVLRRPLTDSFTGFIIEAAEKITSELSVSPQISDGVPDPCPEAWAELAIKTGVIFNPVETLFFQFGAYALSGRRGESAAAYPPQSKEQRNSLHFIGLFECCL